jgi:sirohydrochlorin cobaltochelatase
MVNTLNSSGGSVESFLAQALAAGAFRCGEIQVAPVAEAAVELRHYCDVGRAAEELTRYEDAEQAAELARYTDAEEYRPLKTAPNLRRGWCLGVATTAELRLALELFYPGRLGAWVAFGAGRLRVTSLRETLGRQSGMYRVTQKLTESQADALIGRFCRSDGGCLRTILWRQDDAGTAPSQALPLAKYDPRVDQCGAAGVPPPGQTPWMPLLCQEACNLLVAEARRVVKGEVN